MNKILLLLFLAGAGATGGYFYWENEQELLPVFRELQVTRGELLNTISATGTIEPVEVVDVGAQIVGRIKSFGPDPHRPGKTVDFGSHINEGDVIAQLDDLPYLAEREQAAADLRLSEAELSRAVAQHDLAAQELERAERLRGTNSQSEYDEAVANEKIALADLAIAQARLEQAKISLKQSDINLDYSTIRSPIDGIVIDRRVNVGQTVVAGLNAPSLFLLARDLSRLQVWAAVNEADIGQVTIGQSVTFRVDAYREAEFAGQVSQIRLNASTSHNVVTYGVIVDIDNTDGKLLPFMTANLQFEVSRKPNVMLVPNQALRWKPELHEVSPVFRQRFTEKNEGLGAASHENTSTNDGNDDDSSSADAEGQTVQVDEPTLWVKHDDGLLKPIPVEIGMSDGVQTEIVAGDVQELTKVAVATIQEKRRDFVSSFVSRVTE